MESSETRPIPWPIILLLTVQLLTGILLMSSRNFITLYLNEIIEYPVAQVTAVIALGQVVGMLTALVGGSLSDRLGHKWVLVWGIGGLAISCILYLTRVPWLIIVLWGIGNAGLSFTTLGSQGYLTLAASGAALGLYSALYNWGYTVGGAAGSPVAAKILGQDNYGALGWALLLFAIPTMLIALMMPHLRPQTAPRKSNADTSADSSYMELLRRPRIFALIMLRFLPTCYYGMTTALMALLIKQLAGNNNAVAWYSTGSLIFASLTQLVAGRAADKYGVRLPTIVSFGAILISIAGIILGGQWLWGLYLFGALGLGAAWALSTLLPGLVAIAAEPAVHGRVYGLLHLLWNAGMILGALVGGKLIAVGIWLPFAMMGALNVGALLLAFRFFEMQEPAPTWAEPL